MAEVSGSREVVIVGGGFAGLFAARMLARAPVRVTLIDRAEHHLFQPGTRRKEREMSATVADAVLATLKAPGVRRGAADA